jgi:hypothetical protein
MKGESICREDKVRRVVEAYSSPFQNPIRFSAGDRISVGRRDKKNPGWIWALLANGNAGWAPEQYLEIDESIQTAVARSDYDATELSVQIGDEVFVSKSLAGWYWVRLQNDGSEGWVPAACLERR